LKQDVPKCESGVLLQKDSAGRNCYVICLPNIEDSRCIVLLKS